MIGVMDENEPMSEPELVGAWRDADRAAELTQRLSTAAADALRRADRSAEAAEQVATLAEQVARSATIAAVSARAAAVELRQAADGIRGDRRDASAANGPVDSEAAATGRQADEDVIPMGETQGYASGPVAPTD